MISFDAILDTKIKSGIYQIRTFLFIGLIQFTDGIENVYMSILNSILQNEYTLGKMQVATLGSSYLGGIVAGNLICAYLADYYGRKPIFILFRGLAVIFVLLMSFSNSYSEILIYRFMFGAIYGLTSPLGFVFISEITEAQNRGRFLFALTIMFVAGKIYLVLCCFIFLQNYISGNWKGLLLISIIPLLIGFIASILYLDESIRYYLNKGQYQQAFKQIEYMSQLNFSEESQNLTSLEKDGLIRWQLKLNKQNQDKDDTQQGLFCKPYFFLTIQLLLLSIGGQLQKMSIYLLMPFLFASEKQGFETMLILYIIEMIFVLFIYQYIDDQKYGRIRLFVFSSILLIFANLSLFIFKGVALFWGILMIKLAVRSIQSITNILTCECYPLHLRSKACGIIQAAGRLATVPSPYLFYPLFYYSEYLPFLLLAVLAILMTLSAITLKDDKTQKHLDRSDRSVEEKEKEKEN